MNKDRVLIGNHHQRVSGCVWYYAILIMFGFIVRHKMEKIQTSCSMAIRNKNIYKYLMEDLMERMLGIGLSL